MFDIKVDEIRAEILRNKIKKPYRIGLLLDRDVYEEFQEECKPISLSGIIHLYMVKELARLKAKKRAKK